jgi:hypothetical protein
MGEIDRPVLVLRGQIKYETAGAHATPPSHSLSAAPFRTARIGARTGIMRAKRCCGNHAGNTSLYFLLLSQMGHR